MFVCNAQCWHCYLRVLPNDIILKCYPDANRDFEQFVAVNMAGAFNQELELVGIRFEDTVYGDITAAPTKRVKEFAQRVMDRRYDLWFATSNLLSIDFFEELKSAGVPIKIKLTIHSLDGYCAARGNKKKDKDVLKQCAQDLIAVADEIMVMQVAFPMYFGWPTITETAEFFLQIPKVKTVAWYRPYYNRWMNTDSKWFSLQGGQSFVDHLEQAYGLKRFQSFDLTWQFAFRGVRERLKGLPADYVLFTSQAMVALLREKFKISNKIVGVANKFFGGTVSSAGLLTMQDFRDVPLFWETEKAALPKEFGYAGNYSTDLLGVEIGRGVLWV